MLVWILSMDKAPLMSHAEVASHMPQLEGPTTKNIYNYILLGFGEKMQKRKKKEDWQQLLAQVLIFRKIKT